MDAWADIFSFDGNWFDIATVAGGLLYAVINRYRLKTPRDFFCLATGLDAFNGMAIVPLIFLAGTLFSTHMLTALVHFNRVIICGTGILSLFAIIEMPVKSNGL